MSNPKQKVPPEWKKGGLSYGHGLTYSQAKKIIDAAEKEAKRQGLLMSIAVVDAGGNLLAFGRMDNAMLVSIQIAMDKAFTAVFGKLPSHIWGHPIQTGEIPPLFIHHRLTPFSGGFPIIKNKEVIGGDGCRRYFCGQGSPNRRWVQCSRIILFEHNE